MDEDRQEWKIRKEKAAIVREREEDLEPERNRIGGLLCGYYRKQIEDNKERQIKISNQKVQIKDDVAQEKDCLENYREEIKKIIEQKGGLRSLVRNYDNTEIKYNTRYKENLSRNILGIYEPGMLEIKQETYEQEIEERKDILKYLELPQEKLFAREEILHKAWGKIEELEDRKRKLEKKEDVIRKEHKLLASGRVMELPENLREEFEKFDIPVIYGMEWLKKNGFGEEKNKRIVSKNPFLPYSLILTQQELKKLSEKKGETWFLLVRR